MDKKNRDSQSMNDLSTEDQIPGQGTEKVQKGVSRRGFLAGASLLAVGGALAACSPSGDAQSNASSNSQGSTELGAWPFPATSYTFDDAVSVTDADIVVVGGGAGGTCAALNAVDSGAKVAWVERHSSLGGTAQFSEGIFGVNSNYQNENNISVTAEEVFKKYMEFSHYRTNPDLAHTLIERSGSTVNWMQEKGVTFYDCLSVVATDPNSLRTWHLYDGFGVQAFKTLADQAIAGGAEVFLETTGSNLIMEDGKVAGLAALNDKEEVVAFRAPVVVIATGGYGDNKEMMKYFLGGRYDTDALVNIGLNTHNGEGINMGVAAGAQPYNVGVVNTHVAWHTAIPITSSLYAAQQDPYLWVNKDGKRFVNEFAVCLDPALQGNALSMQPEMIMRTIFDSDTKDKLKESVLVPKGAHFPAGTPLTDIDEALEKGVEDGVAYKADTIEDLAKQLDMDPEVLVKTIEEYNVACDSGYDENFYKDPFALLAVKKAPFYAIPTDSYSFTSTVGGLKIDPSARVLDTEDNPIPGLYATGSDASGMYGCTYDFVVSGTTIGFASNMGIIATEHAVENILA